MNINTEAWEKHEKYLKREIERLETEVDKLLPVDLKGHNISKFLIKKELVGYHQGQLELVEQINSGEFDN